MTEPRRIVQVLTQASGGPADHAADVAIELAKRDYDSHLVAPDGPAVRRTIAHGVKWHNAVMADKADVRAGVMLARLLADLSPDVLHCQDRRAGLIGRGVGRATRVAAVIYTLHGVHDGLSDLVAGNVRAAPRRRRDALYYLAAERWITRASGARMVVPSKAVARFAIDHVGVRPALVDVVPNGIDTSRFVPVCPAQGPVTALWLGLMNPVKRLENLIRALEHVPGLHAKIVGDGPERFAIQNLVTEAGLADRVLILPRVDDPVPVFGGCHFFVLTSAAENCPLSLLQAMSSGLPVVATAVGGIPEVVRQGVDGLLVPADDQRSLVHALQLLAEDPQGRERMGASARERVCGDFTIESTAELLLDSYRKAASCRS